MYRFQNLSQEHFRAYHVLLGQLSSQYREDVDLEKLWKTISEEEKKNIYLLLNNDIVIGTIKIFFERKFYNDDCWVGHIEDVVVDEKHRGGGIGRILIQHALNLSSKMGCYKTVLYCSTDNTPFYEKCGFKRNGILMSSH